MNIKSLEKKVIKLQAKVKLAETAYGAACKELNKASRKAGNAIGKLNDIDCDLEEAMDALDEAREQAADEPLNNDAVARGDIPNAEQAELMKTQKFSFSVVFQRRKANKGKVIKESVRCFTTRQEADHHGERFTAKHNHVGWDVVRVNKKANAWVNWKTGKTNPAI